MRLILFALLLLSSPVQSQNSSPSQNHPANTQGAQNKTEAAQALAQPVVSQQNDQADHSQRTAHAKPTGDTVYLLLTGAIALAAVFQAIIAWRQGKTFEKQYDVMSQALIASNQSAESALKGVVALEKLERPFLMVELRGNDKFKDEIWLINKGKVPAQILWFNPSGSLRIQTREQMEEMPTAEKFDYGFLHDQQGAQVLNVPWIAPEGEMKLTWFDWISLKEDLKHAYQTQQKFAFLLSTVKYRGMLNDTIFESRWCCRWFGESHGGLRLDGPHGYNSYT